ncbi:hypothetical protein DAI22_07g069150 [Oryza sativa Japonica Group]|nr:hypothetical protein DAI22_07g069150 [Oryza sativa Japonica Group]
MRRPTERIQPPTSLSTPAVGCVRSGRPFGSPRKTRSHPATQRHPGPPTSLLSVWEHGIPSPGPTPPTPIPIPVGSHSHGGDYSSGLGFRLLSLSLSLSPPRDLSAATATATSAAHGLAPSTAASFLRRRTARPRSISGMRCPPPYLRSFS